MVSIFMELGILFVMNYYDGVEIVLEFNSMDGRVVYDGDEMGLMGEGV